MKNLARFAVAAVSVPVAAAVGVAREVGATAVDVWLLVTDPADYAALLRECEREHAVIVAGDDHG